MCAPACLLPAPLARASLFFFLCLSLLNVFPPPRPSSFAFAQNEERTTAAPSTMNALATGGLYEARNGAHEGNERRQNKEWSETQ